VRSSGERKDANESTRLPLPRAAPATLVCEVAD
jgi:hypothetical protein